MTTNKDTDINNEVATPRTDEACEAMGLKAFVVPVETSRQLERKLIKKTNEVERLRQENSSLKAEVELLKQGKVFVDPKWIYDLETQLAKAHDELCQAGLREYGN
jgi:predicted RNase H-like nuclease (RuvC/YqgF family)